ncbi:MAG: hypothetical protein U9R69_12035, partial [Thermodesulfobacteriota bacterium]|nr:hypothetical protein [Thermodesulfobacteriota bacterium]
ESRGFVRKMLDSRQTHSGMTGANSQGTLSKFARRAWVAILGQVPSMFFAYTIVADNHRGSGDLRQQ